MSVDLQLELFSKMIKPILLYGSEAWGYSSCKSIESIHLKFLKSIFNLKQLTPNVMIFGEFGVHPTEIDIKIKMISFWSKVAQRDSLKYPHLLYQHLYYSNANMSSKWLDYYKNTLRNTGFSRIWSNQSADNPKRLKDLFINESQRKIDESSSCLNYGLFKDTYKFENYLTTLPFNMRKSLISFRTRNHSLPVEICRWHSIFINERKCVHCNTVGDEFH